MNNKNFNTILVRNGYARVEIVNPNNKYKDYFYLLQQQAIKDKLGLWRLKKEKIPFILDSSGHYVPRYYERVE